MYITNKDKEEINLELDNLLKIVQNIQNKIDFIDNAMLIVKEMEWYYKTLLAKGYEESYIQHSFIDYKFVNIKGVATDDERRIIFLDLIITFWIRLCILKKFDVLLDENEIDNIISDITIFNFLKINKNIVQINHDGFLIKEFIPTILFILNEIIFKGIKINKIDYVNPPLPDFIIEFNYNNQVYLKPIEVTTFTNYGNYDRNWLNLNEKHKNKIYEDLLKKFNKKNTYDNEINKCYSDTNCVLLPTTVIATSAHNFLHKDDLTKIMNYVVEKSVNNNFLNSIQDNQKEYNILDNDLYFYFLYFNFGSNSNINVINEWCIYDKKFINSIVKKWNIHEDKYELENLEFHIDNNIYLIYLKNYYGYYKLEKDNDLYKYLIKVLKCNLDDEYSVVYKEYDENNHLKIMKIELYVSNKYYGKLNPPKVFGTYKYKG